jgi:16S rRNA (uracil1498-N3)-methyltransferase
MAHRFFVERPIASGHATLRGAEAHHLIHVLRAVKGTDVILFDGQGAEFVARVEAFSRSVVELSIVTRVEVNREAATPLILCVALPKPARARWLIEKAVELGVTRVVPLATRQSGAHASAEAIERLRRTVVEASKQCGRNRLMQISDTIAWTDVVRHVARPSEGQHALRWMAHPDAQGTPEHMTTALNSEGTGQEPVYVAVGPERGFSPDEVHLANQAGWSTVRLGPRTLRVETAALAIGALVLLRQ